MLDSYKELYKRTPLWMVMIYSTVGLVVSVTAATSSLIVGGLGFLSYAVGVPFIINHLSDLNDS